MTPPCPTRTMPAAKKPLLTLLVTALALAAASLPPPARSQIILGTPDVQRNALNAVRGQARSLYNATQVARNYGDNGVQIVWQQFHALRNQYDAFAAVLLPRQAADYANEWAELSAGLDILQQAFANYRQDLADGRTSATALSDLCRVVNEAGRVWLQQFNKTATQARVGW